VEKLRKIDGTDSGGENGHRRRKQHKYNTFRHKARRFVKSVNIQLAFANIRFFFKFGFSDCMTLRKSTSRQTQTVRTKRDASIASLKLLII
jgi:hypothetical protein